jgi:hypothetical protein
MRVVVAGVIILVLVDQVLLALVVRAVAVQVLIHQPLLRREPLT